MITIGNGSLKAPRIAPASGPGRKVAVGSFLAFLGLAVSLSTGLVTAAFLTRRLGPVDYGLLVVVSFIIGFIESSIAVAIERAVVKLTATSRSIDTESTSAARASPAATSAGAL